MSKNDPFLTQINILAAIDQMSGRSRIHFVRRRWHIDDSSGLGRCYLVPSDEAAELNHSPGFFALELRVFSFVISCQIIWNYFFYLLTKKEEVHKRSGAVFAESFNKYSLANGTSNYRLGVGKVKHHSEILPQFCLDFFYPAVWRIRKQSWTGQNRNVIQHVQSFCPWSSRGRIMSSSHVWYRPEIFQNAFSLVNIAIQISCTQSGTRSSLRLSAFELRIIVILGTVLPVHLSRIAARGRGVCAEDCEYFLTNRSMLLIT